MHIVLINPPFHAVTSRTGEQIPFGLLAIGGPLRDAGHDVTLIDAEVQYLSLAQTAQKVLACAPDLIMTGHAGSTPAHPLITQMAQTLKLALPDVPIVYGGVFPTYHGQDILQHEAAFDVIVRGEGERTAVLLAQAYAQRQALSEVPGIVYRVGDRVLATGDAEMILQLDDCRVGWELIDNWDLYQCWGAGRAAIIQLSRGCPHPCTYCGQRGFWSRWRYRTPEQVAEEIAWLYHEHGVTFIDLADENPTSVPRIWQRFLEAMIEQNVPVKLFATLRAADVVRDKDILTLYKQAGFECILMGIETTDEKTMALIRKGSTLSKDYQAIQLLREHRILSMVGYIVGFEEERWSDYWHSIKQMLWYDPDLLNAMYVTPHRWTPFYAESGHRQVVLEDRSKWDYRHQVLATKYMQPWQVFLAVKTMEVFVHLRPRALMRLLAYPDGEIRKGLRWCIRHAAGAWWDEIMDFMRTRYRRNGQSLFAFWGSPLASVEKALKKPEVSVTVKFTANRLRQRGNSQ